MTTPMIPCSSCSRHVRVSDAACPFCRAELPADAAARAVPGPSGRMPRAAMAVFAATLTVAACGDGDGPDTGQTTPVYGAPAQGGQAGGAGSAGNAGSSGTGGSAGTGGGTSGQGGASGTAGATLGGGGVGGDMSGPGAGGAGPVYGAPATGGAAGDTSGGSGGAVPIYGAAPQ